jgi:HPt (histidine-containing phosphotransfer) domain-containing protein
MEELKQGLARIQSEIESFFSSISQELKSTESFLAEQSKGFDKPLENLEKELKTMKTNSESDSSKRIAELDKLLA